MTQKESELNDLLLRSVALVKEYRDALDTQEKRFALALEVVREAALFCDAQKGVTLATAGLFDAVEAYVRELS